MQHKTLKYRMQTTGTAGSLQSAWHNETLKSSRSYCRFLLRKHLNSTSTVQNIAALPTAFNKSNPRELQEISSGYLYISQTGLIGQCF